MAAPPFQRKRRRRPWDWDGPRCLPPSSLTVAAAVALLLAVVVDGWRLGGPVTLPRAHRHQQRQPIAWALGARPRARIRLGAAGTPSVEEAGSDSSSTSSSSSSMPTIELTDWVSEGEELWEGSAAATAAAFRQRQQRRQQQQPGQGQQQAQGPWVESESTALALPSDGSGAEDQLPVKIQREANLVWFELSQGGRLAYLREEDRLRIKQALVVLAAFRTLFDHPAQVLRAQSAEDCFRQADADGNGQVSFEEFLRWYRGSHDGSSGSSQSTSAPARSSSSSSSTAIVPFGEGAAARSLEGVAMRDLLRQFLAEKEQRAGGGGAGGGRMEEEVLEDLDRCIETAQVLLELEADADTVLAALATHFLGLEGDVAGNLEDEYAAAARDRTEKLAVVKSQCGPIVHQIVQDSSRLGGLFRAPPEATQFRRDPRAYQALLDLDHHNAKLAREYLMAANSDARAFVVHMAGLVYALRNQHRLPVHRRHLLALESLQLYVPVASALGLGSRLKEMEELSYRGLFPESYDRFAAWHRDFADMGQVALIMARERIAERIEAFTSLRQLLDGYEIHGRVKSVVSAFKKVFKKDKLPEELHDMLGLRVILRPLPLRAALPSPASPPDPRLLELPEEIVMTTTSRAAASTVTATAVMPETKEEEGGSGGHGGALALAEALGIDGGGHDDAGAEQERALEAWLCHRVRELIVDMWEEVPGRYKNYVDHPKPNGYQSLHTGVVLMEGGGTAEVQIRTARMHFEAEHGVASHALYKAEIQTPDKVAAFRSKHALGSGGGGGGFGGKEGKEEEEAAEAAPSLLPSASLSSSVEGGEEEKKGSLRRAEVVLVDGEAAQP